jgi:chitin disaccharide deacetylase
MTPGGGLLIVNADDLGRTQQETDAIVACWRAGRVSSATHMVWMDDSSRAAGLASEAGLPTGLHLNLARNYTAADAPAGARERQARLVRHLRVGESRVRPLVYDPRLRGTVNDVIADQLAAFRALYGREPTHVDGHHHSHLVPNAVLSRSLARGTRMRRAFTFLPGERAAPSRALRRARNALVAGRFQTTDWLFDLRELHPALGGSGLDDKLELARSASVEVMAHPGLADEYELLMGEEWRLALEGLRRGSFAALA